MTLPGFYVKEEELSLNIPADSDLIAGIIGPATKGTPQQLQDFVSEPGFTAAFGEPVNRQYASRAGIRFLRKGSRLKFVRVAGSLLSYARRVFYASGTKIVTIYAASPGTWANQQIGITIIRNSTTSYNVRVYEKGKPVNGEYFANVTNGSIATRINGMSKYITVMVDSGAGTLAPDETRDLVTGAVTPQLLNGGDDGAFASTRSADSSTGGIAGKRFFGRLDAVIGSRTWDNLHTITAADAGLAEYRGTFGMPVQPGAVTLRIQVLAGPTFVELTDDEDDVLVNGMPCAGVGLLRDATSTHRGFVNYRTGEWGIQLVGGPVGFLTGTIDGIYLRARADAVGSLLSGQAAYVGALASPAVCPGGVASARAQFHADMDDTVCTDSGLAGALHTSADLNAQPLDGFVVPGTVAVTAPTATGTQTVYDHGFGGWRTAPGGGGTAVVGTLNYRTGAWSITFPVVVPANSVIMSEYQLMVSDMGSNAVAGTGGAYYGAEVACTNATGGAPLLTSADLNCAPLVNLPVVPGSIRFVCSSVGGGLLPETVYDDGLGGLCTRRRGDPNAVDVVGTVDYTTGAWSITFSGNVNAAATLTASYVAVAESDFTHSLRGSVGRLDYTDPAAANSYKGLNWLNYATGQFNLQFVLGATKDVKNNGTLYAVYQHGTILGWGNGTATAFSGTVTESPYRRETRRLTAFQAAQQSVPGSGETQAAFATTGVADFWNQNVAGGPTANPVDFATGVTQVTWSAAPYNGEAVFVVGEEVVGHVTCQWTGCIGNERTVLTDGLHCILDASPSDPTKLRFRVMFNAGIGAVAVEEWDLLVDFTAVMLAVNAVDGTGSNLVTLEYTGAGTEPDVAAAQNIGMAGAFDNADIIGAKVGPTYTGLYLFSNTDVVAVDVLMVPGQWHRQVQDAGIQLCETPGRRALWEYSIPDFTPPEMMSLALPGVRSTDLATDAVNFVNGSYNAAVPGGPSRPNAWVPYPPQVAVDSDYAAVHAFYLKYYCQYRKQDVWEGPEGDFAQLAAKTDKDFERWYPVAGLQRGKFADVLGLRYSPDVPDRTIMYEFDGTIQNCVNPLRSKVGLGLFIDGQRTMYRTSSMRDRINIRLLLNKLENLLELANMRYEFELNDPILWRQVAATGREIVKPMIAKRGLWDAVLVCDKTTNTPDKIRAKTCKARLMIQPVEAAEVIEYDVILVPQGVSFEEVTA